VYNMEVDDLHCYTVGRNGVLVHNSNGPETGPAPLTPAQIQARWEADLARNARIAAQMRRQGATNREIAEWRRIANERATNRFNRANAGGSDTLQPWPAPPGIAE
jgi:hypothetical protein